MKVQTFSHFGICVRDPERSMRFYCDLLGFERVSKLVLDPDGVRVELIEMPGDPTHPLGEPLCSA